jgi:hypothetical protein
LDIQDGSGHCNDSLSDFENYFWEINMELIVLSLMILGLLTVFTVDVIQKRRAFVSNSNADR